MGESHIGKKSLKKKWNEMGRSLIGSKTFFKSQDEKLG